MIRALILTMILGAVVSACAYREEKTVVPAQPTAIVSQPASVTYVEPLPSSTVVYTR